MTSYNKTVITYLVVKTKKLPESSEILDYFNCLFLSFKFDVVNLKRPPF